MKESQNNSPGSTWKRNEDSPRWCGWRRSPRTLRGVRGDFSLISTRERWNDGDRGGDEGEGREEEKARHTVTRVLRVGGVALERLDLPHRLVSVGVATLELDLEALEEAVEFDHDGTGNVTSAHVGEGEVADVSLEELEDDVGKTSAADHGLALQMRRGKVSFVDFR